MKNFKSKRLQYKSISVFLLGEEGMFSHKIVALTFTMLFVLSAFTVVVAASVECPRCHGTGHITSSTCLRCGGSGQIQPNINSGHLMVGSSPTQTNLSRTYHNNENVDVYAVATATINTQKTILTETSNRTLLKANSYTTILLTFDKLKDENYFTHQFELTAEPITCPDCNGSGAGSLIVCPDCGGTGYISEAAANGGFDFSGIVLPAAGVAAVAALSAAGVLVVRKRRLTEEKLRMFTSSEFLRWVLGCLHGNEASILDSRKGIDGFTGDGSALVARQADNVGKSQIDVFLNSIMQVKSREGVFVAFSFSSDASAAVVRGRINYRIDVKLITVKELLTRKGAVYT
ncbi:MAG: hypothetical protein ACQCN5_01335 [Candidatus Bathyarchaeia archaeon]